MIAIPNMSKPKICYMCPLSDETWFCPIVGEAIPRANRKLENCPLIDIVRCGECTHHDEDGWGYGECKRPSVDYLRTANEDFCSYGERRIDDKEIL